MIPAEFLPIAYLLLVLGAFVMMEGVAWALHKYVMHGFLWTLHQDHHFPKKRGLQRNDAFALFFSGLSFFFIYTGIADGLDFKLYIGIGVTLYGVGYFTFHDIMFHRRVRRLKYKPKSRYMKRIFKAHSTHHQKSGAPHTGVSFGFLFASKKYDV